MEPPGTSSFADGSERIAAVTVDVHGHDSGADIEAAANVLAERGVRATFFIPGSLFGASRRISSALRALPRLHHEVGTHAHHHDGAEIEALMDTTGSADLSFLTTARSRFADFYGWSPAAFRSPVWCRLSDAALDELVRLGYEIDSSATPQRVQVLSSRPYGRGWLLCRRSPHLIRPQLLEIPTTTALVPAGSTAFRLMRRRLSVSFVRLLLTEAALFPPRVVVVQFDSKDLNQRAIRKPPIPFRSGDVLLKRDGGFKFKRYLLDSDSSAVATTAGALLRLLSRTATLSEVRAAWLARQDAR